MPVPALLAAAAPYAISAIGALVGGRLAGKRPTAPDLSEAVGAEFGRARAQVGEQMDRSMANAAADAAASGYTGSGGAAQRMEVLGSAASTLAGLSAQQASAVADAKNRTRMMDYQGRLEGWSNRAQGISDMIGAAAYAASNLGKKAPGTSTVITPTSGISASPPSAAGFDYSTLAGGVMTPAQDALANRPFSVFRF